MPVNMLKPLVTRWLANVDLRLDRLKSATQDFAADITRRICVGLEKASTAGNPFGAVNTSDPAWKFATFEPSDALKRDPTLKLSACMMGSFAERTHFVGVDKERFANVIAVMDDPLYVPMLKRAVEKQLADQGIEILGWGERHYTVEKDLVAATRWFMLGHCPQVTEALRSGALAP